MPLTIDRNQTISRAIIGGKTMSFETIEAKFAALAEQWADDNAGFSRINFHNSNYHQIIGMGTEVIPLLLERLRRGEPDWIYALKCITGEQAEKAESLGDQGKVIADWVAWGNAKGNNGGSL